MQHALVEYGYGAVIVGCFLEGETVLLLAGVAAQLGYLALPQVVAAAAIGGFCSDETAFFVGRHFGPRLVGWSPRLATIQPAIRRKLQQHAIWVGFTVRFAIGLRTAVPVVVGASGLAPIRFALPNAAGAIAWAIAIGGAGYFFGRLRQRYLMTIRGTGCWRL